MDSIGKLPDAVTLDQLPLHLVAEDLEAGRLVNIVSQDWGPGPHEIPLYGIHRADDLPGPAGQWLLENLEQAAVRADGELGRLAARCAARRATRSKSV